jgi:hypothetical protein
MLRTVGRGIVVGRALWRRFDRYFPTPVVMGMVPTTAHRQVDREHNSGGEAKQPVHFQPLVPLYSVIGVRIS